MDLLVCQVPVKCLVEVSSGRFHAFHVIFVPLEYVPTIPPRYTYARVSGLYFVQNKKRPQTNSNKLCQCGGDAFTKQKFPLFSLLIYTSMSFQI